MINKVRPVSQYLHQSDTTSFIFIVVSMASNTTESSRDSSIIQSKATTVVSTSKNHNNAIHAQILLLPKELRNLLAGGLAGMTAKTIVAPIDRIKIIYQVSSAPFHLRMVPKVAWNIIQTEGIAALWKGNTATMIRVFPYSGIQFMVFAKFKAYFLNQQIQRQKNLGKNTEKEGMSPLESLIGGSCAGALSVLFTYPLDLTRAQLAVIKKKTYVDSFGTQKKNVGFTGLLINNYSQGVRTYTHIYLYTMKGHGIYHLSLVYILTIHLIFLKNPILFKYTLIYDHIIYYSS